MITQLETQNLSRKYDGILALDQVSMRASAGLVTSIVGVNGAGKTTLLRTLAGLDKLSDGRILIDSYDTLPDALRTHSTMIFQKSVILSGTVYDNVAYGLRLNNTPRSLIKDKVQSALRSVNLTDFARRKAHKLSSGEQQRVAIARAIVIERDVLLIDEPTANLDPANTTIIEQVVRDSAHSRITILSTHNLNQARRLSDRIIHLHKGRIIEERDAAGFFGNPHDETTKLFIKGELQ